MKKITLIMLILFPFYNKPMSNNTDDTDTIMEIDEILANINESVSTTTIKSLAIKAVTLAQKINIKLISETSKNKKLEQSIKKLEDNSYFVAGESVQTQHESNKLLLTNKGLNKDLKENHEQNLIDIEINKKFYEDKINKQKHFFSILTISSIVTTIVISNKKIRKKINQKYKDLKDLFYK